MTITKKNLKDIELYLHPKQINGYIQGHELYQYLKDENLLEDCLTLEDLKDIQKLGLEEFNKYFKDKYVFAWKSVVGGSVPCLVGGGGRVVLSWYWLDDDWGADSPALRRKSALSTKKLEPLEPESLDLNSRVKKLEEIVEKLTKVINI